MLYLWLIPIVIDLIYEVNYCMIFYPVIAASDENERTYMLLGMYD